MFQLTSVPIFSDVGVFCSSIVLLTPNGRLLIVPLLHAVYVRCGKAVPLQAWSGPEGSRKLKFPDFMTTAQDGGKVVSLTHRPPLPPGKAPGTYFC